MRRSGRSSAASAATAAAAAATTTSNLPPPLVAANVYISEGRRRDALDGIVRAIAATGAVIAPGATPWRGEGRDGSAVSPPATPPHPPSAALLHAFPDAAYNRTGFTLVGTVRGGGQAAPAVCGLTAAVVAAARAGLAVVDLPALRGPGGGDHPTLGSVDHIAVHPLAGGSTLADAAGIARAVAAALGEPEEEGSPSLPSSLAVPAFVYGAAATENHPAHSTSLAALRRALGYFRPPLAPGGAGGGGGDDAGFPDPDFGPAGSTAAAAAALAAHGRVAVGATPWVVNWNIPLGGPACDAALATSIARAVSTRGGGRLPGVEALALPHQEEGGTGGGGDGGGGGGGEGGAPSFPWEVATNLRDPARAPPAAVEAEVRAVVDRLGGGGGGIVVGPGYCTGRDPEALAAAARRALGV